MLWMGGLDAEGSPQHPVLPQTPNPLSLTPLEHPSTPDPQVALH